nr:unnamed protein product [Spirometra erinaceieuropaei]
MIVEPILLAVRQNPKIAVLVSHYLLYMMPGLWFVAVYQTLIKYVQAQNRVVAPLIIGITGNCINALLHYILLYHLETGITICKGDVARLVHLVQTGSSWTCYDRTRMVDFRIWDYSSRRGGREGASNSDYYLQRAVSLLYPVAAWTGDRVKYSGWTGSWRTERTKTNNNNFSDYGASLFCFNNQRDYISRTSIRFAQDFYIRQGAGCGIVRGSGMQTVGALICFVTLYLIFEPLGLCLLFLTPLRLRGLWWALAMGSFVEAVAYTAVCFNINWQRQVELAIARTHISLERERLPSGEIPVVDETDSRTTLVTTAVTFLRSYGVRASSNCVERQNAMIEAEKPGPLSYVPEHQNGDVLLPASPSEVILVPSSTRLPMALFCRRLILLAGLVLIFIISLMCRLCLHWSDYFGVFCVYEDGSFERIEWPTGAYQNDSFVPMFDILPINCSLIMP